jgi:hypothetical protein
LIDIRAPKGTSSVKRIDHQQVLALATAIIGAAGSAVGGAAAPGAGQGQITVREYLRIEGTSLDALTSSPKFPGSPDVVAYAGRLEWPTGADDSTLPRQDSKDDYGVQIIGYLYPLKTADYVFAIASDDQGILYLSTDDTPAHKVEIAREPEWNAARDFAGTARRTLVDENTPEERYINVSKRIRLEAGKAYYIEAQMKEGKGGDNLAVAWTDDGSKPQSGDLPIPGIYLATFDQPIPPEPRILSFSGKATGFTFVVADGAAAGGTVDASSIGAELDRTAIGVDVKKERAFTTVSFVSPTILPSGSSHTAKLALSSQGDPARTITEERSFAVPPYTILTPDMKVPDVDASKPGFSLFVHQVILPQPVTELRAETQLAGELKEGDELLPNIADLTGVGSDQRFVEEGTINYGFSVGGLGRFSPDKKIPGIPGVEGGANNFAMEILTFLDLPAGFIRMGVNSNDGFKTTVGRVADVLESVRLGGFEGARTAADRIFEFVVQEAGVYPFRTIWFKGAGDPGLEWFTVNDDKKILINDKASDGAIKAYRARTGTVPAFVKATTPVRDAVDVRTTTYIEVILQDAGTLVNKETVRLTLNGNPVAATVSKAGTETKASFAPPTDLESNTRYTAGVTYSDNNGTSRTATWNFTTTILGADSLFIEAEDFDFGKGNWVKDRPIGMSGRYPGGAYQDQGDGLNGTFGDDSDFGIDYFEVNPGNDSPLYRPNTAVETLSPPMAGLNRGTFDVEVNFVVGWNDQGDWFNYTRVFPEPARNYAVYGRLSSGGAPIAVQLGQVTAGAKTRNQTVKKLGVFQPGRATGGWAAFEFFPLEDDTGEHAIVTLGGEQTLRLTILPGNVDMDFLAFVPVKKPSIGPPGQFVAIRRDGANIVFEWTGGGTLQMADEFSGPWTDIEGATSPRSVAPAGDRRFFRLKQ